MGRVDPAKVQAGREARLRGALCAWFERFGFECRKGFAPFGDGERKLAPRIRGFRETPVAALAIDCARIRGFARPRIERVTFGLPVALDAIRENVGKRDSVAARVAAYSAEKRGIGIVAA